MTKSQLRKQAKEILQMAEDSGLEQSYLFITTFKRYQTQLEILDGLEKELKKDGVLVTKEYVKGRQNLYANPAINSYNQTVNSANKTVSTLLSIIKTLGEEKEEEDSLDKFLNEG